MKKNNHASRRNFIKKMAASAAAVAAGTHVLGSGYKPTTLTFSKRPFFSANDNINIALIGAGGMGTQDVITALSTPGIKIVAACDLYDGRLKDAKTKWGKDLFTTRSYKEVLSRKDVDAVIVATPDHWHQRISVESLHIEDSDGHPLEVVPASPAHRRTSTHIFLRFAPDRCASMCAGVR